MKSNDKENIALDNLLHCSQHEEASESNIAIHSWDEMSSWKCVTPMCTYVKAKRKKDGGKSKKKNFYDKQSDRDSAMAPDHECDSYLEDCHRSKNLAYSSTDVLSYDSPTSRDIVDTKTFDYLERERYQHISDYLLRQRARNILDSYSPNSDDTYVKEGGVAKLEDLTLLSSPDRLNEKSKYSERKELPCMDQMNLASIKFSLRNNYAAIPDSKHDSSQHSTSKTDERTKTGKKKGYGKSRGKEPRYDHDLIKIQTLQFPPVERYPRRRPKKNVRVDDDESEDDACFPFRISRVSDGRSVAQNIDVDNMATYIVEQKYMRLSSKSKEEKGLTSDELPPLAGLYVS